MSELEYRPGLADVPVAESAVSFIDGKRARLEYRGIAVETLARESTFEETAWLLLKGDLPTQTQLADFDDALRHHRRLQVQAHRPDQVPARDRPSDGRPAGRRRRPGHVLSRRATSPTPQSNWDSALRLIAKLPTHRGRLPPRSAAGDEPIAPRDDLDHAANFYYMLFEPRAVAGRRARCSTPA